MLYEVNINSTINMKHAVHFRPLTLLIFLLFLIHLLVLAAFSFLFFSLLVSKNSLLLNSLKKFSFCNFFLSFLNAFINIIILNNHRRTLSFLFLKLVSISFKTIIPHLVYNPFLKHYH